MKKELFLFVFLSVVITLIDLGAQTRYTVVNFSPNQPLPWMSLITTDEF